MGNLDGHVEGSHMYTREYAVSLDSQDALRHMSREFYIPSKSELKAKALPETEEPQPQDGTDTHDSDSPCVYLCGNSLGLQPRLTSIRLQEYLKTWSTQGVFGHFKPLEKSPLPTWLHADSDASEKIAPIVGGKPSEVAVMETLTANLHFLMAAFYKPDINGRHKIIIESKAFPSDHYAVESQIHHHGLSPSTSMMSIEPPTTSTATLTTPHILSTIAAHASTTALLLLPGIQFYTGQLLDIRTITAFARARGIFVIWDLAHAVGNVPLHLHDWDVDAAAWCTYKYLNAGPGSIAGLFVHERNSTVSASAPASGVEAERGFVNRLSGWWGNDVQSRFKMINQFVPVPGAAGFQLSNPSILDITSLSASLEMFALAGGMEPLREKSIRVTAYLETLLLRQLETGGREFEIITPRGREERGAQLSLKLGEGLLDVVMEELERRGVVVDERRPDVIRVAPAPLYNSFCDCFDFVVAFGEALDVAVGARKGEVQVDGTKKLEITS